MATPKKKTTSPAKKPGPRADLGANIDGFFEKHAGAQRETLDALRALIEAAIPTAEASLKWGMPMWTIDGEIVCGLRAAKKHVGLILSGPTERFVDPDGLLEGEGKTGRQFKVTDAAGIPKKQVTAWLKAAAR